eukprot:scaffold890_cov269-Pinguiococcus_pyrenoidosus.AAC.11
MTQAVSAYTLPLPRVAVATGLTWAIEGDFCLVVDLAAAYQDGAMSLECVEHAACEDEPSAPSLGRTCRAQRRGCRRVRWHFGRCTCDQGRFVARQRRRRIHATRRLSHQV